MSLVYNIVTPDDVNLKRMEDTLQSAILAAGHVCADAVKNIVTNNITKAEQFHADRGVLLAKRTHAQT